MTGTDNRLGIGCLSVLYLVFGLLLIVAGVKACNADEDVRIPNKSNGSDSPSDRMDHRVALAIGVGLVGLGVAGCRKLYKDRNRYPF